MMTNNFQNMLCQIKNNPAKFFNIPQGVNINDPNSIIQHLLNTGKTTQQQVNQLANQAMQIQKMFFK